MVDLTVISRAGKSADRDRLQLFYTRPAARVLIREERGVEISEKTLANWAWSGKGPQWRRMGRRRVAQGHEILEFVDSILTPTKPKAA